MKTKLFNAVLDVVHEVTEVSREDIMSLRKEEYILEARVLLVWFLNRNGMHTLDIAKFLDRKSPSSIDKKLRDYHIRTATSVMFNCYTKKIASILPARIQQVAESDIQSTMQF